MSNIHEITSLHNPVITETASLKDKKHRDKAGLFVIEGERFTAEITNDWDLCYYILSNSFASSHGTEIYQKRSKTYVIPETLFRKVSDAVTPQGVLAVCRQRNYTLEQIIGGKKNILLLILNETQDPGNTGSMLRIADASGADGVILSTGCADIYNTKTLRAAAGSVFHLPFVQSCDIYDTIKLLKKSGVSVYGAHLKTEIFPYSLDFTKNCAIIIGNEANGLSSEISGLCDSLVKIPILGKAESLNASVAGAILMYEAVRQRLSSAT